MQELERWLEKVLILTLSGFVNTTLQGVPSDQIHRSNGSSQLALDFLPFATASTLTINTLKEDRHVLGRGNHICNSPKAKKPRPILCTQFCESSELGVRSDLEKKKAPKSQHFLIQCYSARATVIKCKCDLRIPLPCLKSFNDIPKVLG